MSFTSSATTTVTASLIARVTDRSFPSSIPCDRSLLNSPYLPNNVGRKPINDVAWPGIVACCDEAPISIYAIGSACEAFCNAGESVHQNVTSIYQCMQNAPYGTLGVDQDAGTECDFCNPDLFPSSSRSVAISTSQSVSGSTSTSGSGSIPVTSAPVTSVTIIKSTATSSTSSSTHSGGATKATAGAGILGVILLGLAAL